MNVAGHRLSTGEVEDAVTAYDLVSECAVVAAPDKMKLQVPVAFVVLKKGEGNDETKKGIIAKVVEKIGPTAKPRDIIFVNELPKTRSGKIMRRILKKLVTGEEIGNTMTLKNPECVEELKKIVNYKN